MTDDHITTDYVSLPFVNLSDDEFYSSNADVTDKESNCDVMENIFETFKYTERAFKYTWTGH